MEIALLVKLQLKSLGEARVKSKQPTLLKLRTTQSSTRNECREEATTSFQKQEEESLTCLPDIYFDVMWFPCKSCRRWFKTNAYLLSQEFVPHC